MQAGSSVSVHPYDMGACASNPAEAEAHKKENVKLKAEVAALRTELAKAKGQQGSPAPAASAGAPASPKGAPPPPAPKGGPPPPPPAPPPALPPVATGSGGYVPMKKSDQKQKPEKTSGGGFDPSAIANAKLISSDPDGLNKTISEKLADRQKSADSDGGDFDPSAIVNAKLKPSDPDGLNKTISQKVRERKEARR